MVEDTSSSIMHYHMESGFVSAFQLLHGRLRKFMSCTLLLSIALILQHNSSAAANDQSACGLADDDGFGYLLQPFDSVFSSPFTRKLSQYEVVSVDWYGAVGDGRTDDTKAFADAWTEACSLDLAVFLIPAGSTYLVNVLDFKGPCGSSLIVELAGTVIAPPCPSDWKKSKSNAWLHFSHMNDLTIEGGGTVDGQGHQWWAESCKVDKKIECHAAPTALKFTAVHNLKVRNLQSVNSPRIHVDFSQCYGVQAVNLRVSAPATSPNTDGIHISGTQNVHVQGCSIGTGDDCLSIVSGSSAIRVTNLTCGPGHGISIGSLGNLNSEEYVSLVVVDGAILTGTANGVRIKTWQGGTGSAIGFLFQNVQMNNVSYPIVINQNYCDSAFPCHPNKTAAVQVSKVFYKNIWGTSATEQAVKLECSNVAPCKNLLLQDISLTMASGSRRTTSLCKSARGIAVGNVTPSVDCLQTTHTSLYSTM